MDYGSTAREIRCVTGCPTLCSFQRVGCLTIQTYGTRDSLAGCAEVVVRDRHGSISIDGEVLGFMYEVIVSRTLTDDSEVIYIGAHAASP